jgi:2-polyprenyl-6-methoxyphenol hydroxylase-like FAD-dependent oxidoreductase
MEPTTTDVIIVGAGPAGLSLALCLARQGIRSVVLERRPGENEHPRAHYVNTRTMELFRQWGIRDAVLADAYPTEHLPFEMLVPIGGLSGADRALISPASVTSCAQDRIEAALLSVLAGHPTCEVRWGRTFRDVVDHGDHVAVLADGPDGQDSLTGRWLVGADGASSAVRALLGIGMAGDPDLGSLINIYFEGRIDPDDAVPPLAMASPNPDVPGAFICMDGDRRWCFHYWYDPAVESPADFDTERCTQLVRRATGVTDDTPLAVRSIRPWTMTALVADRMRTGSVFLIGDAAHAFPPTGGFGMNSGIQDAHNLAWKLDAVLHGVGGEALLDSYQAERLPVAYLNTAQSLRNAGRGSRNADPSPQAAMIEGRATTSVRSAAAAAGTDEERERIEMLEHAGAIGQDIGFAYDDSPVVLPDGLPRPDIQIARYVPNASPGARAPHVELRGPDGSTVSLIDLLDGAFTLVTGAGGAAWWRAAEQLPADLAPRVVRVGDGQPYRSTGADLEATYGIGPSGAVLVRPDGHVAYRAPVAPADPATALESAVRTARGLVSVLQPQGDR